MMMRNLSEGSQRSTPPLRATQSSFLDVFLRCFLSVSCRSWFWLYGSYFFNDMGYFVGPSLEFCLYYLSSYHLCQPHGLLLNRQVGWLLPLLGLTWITTIHLFCLCGHNPIHSQARLHYLL